MVVCGDIERIIRDYQEYLVKSVPELISQTLITNWAQGLSMTFTLQKKCELEPSLNQTRTSPYLVTKSLCPTIPSLYTVLPGRERKPVSGS